MFVSDDLSKLGEFSEQGRGIPVSASRPGAALPFSPLVRQAYAPTPLVRLGWTGGEIKVTEALLDPPDALAPEDSVQTAARRLLTDDADFVPVVAGGRFQGVVFCDRLLECLADDRHPSDLQDAISLQIPTCGPESALADAVRQMLACWLRRIPVVGADGELLGLLSLPAAAAASERDPSVRDLLEGALSPSLFAHHWR
jgi:CBS domain-containing protein